jgi:hypothetical protein
LEHRGQLRGSITIGSRQETMAIKRMLAKANGESQAFEGFTPASQGVGLYGRGWGDHTDRIPTP